MLQNDQPVEKSSTQRVPQICDTYNHFMNGVDCADVNQTWYDYDHHRGKWTRAALYAVFKIALVNGWIIKWAMSDRSTTFSLFS